MKILHLTGEKEDTGGVLSVIRNLVQASQKLNWQHCVWINQDYQETRRPTLDYRRSQHICANSESHFNIFYCALRAIKEIHGLLHRESFDIIHAHTRGTLLVIWVLAYTRKRDSVFTNHNYARRVGMYKTASKCPRIHSVFLTPNMLRHYGHDSTSDRRRIISGCCSDHFQQVPVIERRNLPKIHFIGIGSLVRWKRWHLILEALHLLKSHELNKIQFSLYGPTLESAESRDYTQNLHSMIHEFGLQPVVKMYGSTHLIEECLRDSDWFLLPSINEPCSIALIEALSLGIPAVTSESGGSIDILQPGKTGLLFEPDNANDLAAKIRMILNGQLSPIAPAMIRDSVRHRSASQVVQEYARLYQQLQELKMDRTYSRSS